MRVEGFKGAEQNKAQESKKWSLDDLRVLNENRDQLNATLKERAKNEALVQEEALATVESEMEQLEATETSESIRNESVEAQFNDVVKKNGPLERVLSFFNGLGRSESKRNLAAMNNIMNDVTNQLGPSSMDSYIA